MNTVIRLPEPYGHLRVIDSFRINSNVSFGCSPGGSLHTGRSFIPAMANVMTPKIASPSIYVKLLMQTPPVQVRA